MRSQLGAEGSLSFAWCLLVMSFSSLTVSLLVQKVLDFLAGKRARRAACSGDGGLRLKVAPGARAWGCARRWEVGVWERAAGHSQGLEEVWNRGAFVLI